MNDPRKTAVATPTGRFGAFGGVFTPCTLTILGVIMFLRYGQVVGNAGVWAAMGIVLAAKTITTLTALSLSAIATNTRVRGGGAYFLISRSLGIEFGGAIGLVFFVAQAVSVAMYVIGFSEALLAAFPGVGLSIRVIGTAVNAVVFACVLIGAGWTIKLQYGILALLGLSLVSFFGGAFSNGSMETLRTNLSPGFTGGASLWTMFALFFPAATGIMAGANMSGDLRDRRRDHEGPGEVACGSVQERPGLRQRPGGSGLPVWGRCSTDGCIGRPVEAARGRFRVAARARGGTRPLVTGPSRSARVRSAFRSDPAG